MRILPMIARHAFVYGGRVIAPGERIEVPAIEAAALRYRRHAEFSRPGQASTPDPSHTPITVAIESATIDGISLEAEVKGCPSGKLGTQGLPGCDDGDLTSVSPPSEGRPRRRYRRRDLEAEE